MLRCTLGERNSGKSVFVEDQIKKMGGKTLYIATLPDLGIYSEIISRHQKRRPSFWRCAELFKMTAGEISTYPYQDFRNVILDNLSYYILFQLYFNGDEFARQCGGIFVPLIDKAAADSGSTLYVIDTPIDWGMVGNEEEGRLVREAFNEVLDRAATIDRFYSGGRIRRMSVWEGKDYLFHM